jgi:hypothetical protein
MMSLAYKTDTARNRIEVRLSGKLVGHIYRELDQSGFFFQSAVAKKYRGDTFPTIQAVQASLKTPSASN